MNRSLTLLIALAVTMLRSVEGVQQPAPAVPPQFVGAVKDLQPPREPGSWILQVISRGGLDGQGAGDRTISSNGNITLERTGVTDSILPDRLRPLGDNVRKTVAAEWTGTRSSVCSDCYVTLMALTLRDAGGTMQTRITFWDPTTQKSVPAEVMRVYEMAMALQP